MKMTREDLPGRVLGTEASASCGSWCRPKVVGKRSERPRSSAGMRVRIVRCRGCHCEAIMRCGGLDWMKGPERCRQQGFEITYNVASCCCCRWEGVWGEVQLPPQSSALCGGLVLPQKKKKTPTTKTPTTLETTSEQGNISCSEPFWLYLQRLDFSSLLDHRLSFRCLAQAAAMAASPSTLNRSGEQEKKKRKGPWRCRADRPMRCYRPSG